MLSGSASQVVVPHGLTIWTWLRAGIILVVAVVIAQAVKRFTVRAFGGHADRPVVQTLGRFVGYVVVLGGFVYALAALKVRIGPLIGALGIGGIALAFALQDILQNLVSGVILQAKRPIRRGDQASIAGYVGTVRDIDLRTVLIRTFDGLDVYLPNRTVLENPIVNYTISPTRRITIPIGVGYASDLEETQRLLVTAVGAVPGVLPDPAPAAWITGFGASSIDFSVLVWMSVSSNLFEVTHLCSVAIKAALDGAGIEIPFPQTTLTLGPGTARASTRGRSPSRARSGQRPVGDPPREGMDPPVLGLPDEVSACLFDLDGVLTDTASVHARAWKDTFDEYLRRRRESGGDGRLDEFDLEGDYDSYVDGRPRADGVRDFLASRDVELPEGDPDDPPDAETVHGLGNRKNELLLARIRSDGVEVFEGSRRYLEAVRAAGMRTAVVSSSANTEEVVEVTGLAPLLEVRVDGVVAAEVGLDGKPAPDTYLEAARRLGVAPGAAAVFEDALVGVEAGRAGSFAAVVGVDRVGQRDALAAHGATVVVGDLAELLEQ